MVITEMGSGAFTEPDIIGWEYGHSILIECKVSKADFIKDIKKRKSEPWKMYDIGKYRYYLVPKGLIILDELPRGWGLLELRGKRIYEIVKPQAFSDYNWDSEIVILLSAIRRIGKCAPDGISVRFYTTQTKCRATLTVCDEKVPKDPDRFRGIIEDAPGTADELTEKMIGDTWGDE